MLIHLEIQLHRTLGQQYLHQPKEPMVFLAVFKSPTSVQDDPLKVSVRACLLPPPASPPAAIDAVCVPQPKLDSLAVFPSVCSVQEVPS